jgi:hypothetical protein
MIHKNFKRSLFAVIALLACPGAFALPGLSLGVMGGGNLAMPNVDAPAGTSIKGAIGYSVGPTVSAGPIEISALYSKYSIKSSVAAANFETTTDSKYIDVPLLYRMGVGLASIGLGGFYGLCIDSGAASDDHNYGAVGSVRVKIPGGLFADARYNLGLKDMSGSKLSSAMLLIGYHFL